DGWNRARATWEAVPSAWSASEKNPTTSAGQPTALATSPTAVPTADPTSWPMSPSVLSIHPETPPEVLSAAAWAAMTDVRPCCMNCCQLSAHADQFRPLPVAFTVSWALVSGSCSCATECPAPTPRVSSCHTPTLVPPSGLPEVTAVRPDDSASARATASGADAHEPPAFSHRATIWGADNVTGAWAVPVPLGSAGMAAALLTDPGHRPRRGIRPACQLGQGVP